MGYESRIIVVNRFENGFDSVITDLKLSRMPNDFVRLFKEKIDFDLYLGSGDNVVATDCYGQELKCADVRAVFDWLEAYEENEGRRQSLARHTLKTFVDDASDWLDRNLCVVHYGY